VSDSHLAIAWFRGSSCGTRRGLDWVSRWCGLRLQHKLYDVDTPPQSGTTFYIFMLFEKSAATPLYYAALCGFHNLAQHLIVKKLQDVNTEGGHYLQPLVAALAGRHFQIAELLCCNGADLNVQGEEMRVPLHSAAYYGDLEVVQKLIKYGVKVQGP